MRAQCFGPSWGSFVLTLSKALKSSTLSTGIPAISRKADTISSCPTKMEALLFDSLPSVSARYCSKLDSLVGVAKTVRVASACQTAAHRAAIEGEVGPITATTVPGPTPRASNPACSSATFSPNSPKVIDSVIPSRS